MPTPSDRLDDILAAYERNKQDETRHQVQRALRLEEVRRRGGEALRRFVLQHARDVAERLEEAGHRVIYQEHLDHYPPNVRIHVRPKVEAGSDAAGPMSSMELVWGDPDPDALCVKVTHPGVGAAHRGSATAGTLDDLWVREHLLRYVRETLNVG